MSSPPAPPPGPTASPYTLITEPEGGIQAVYAFINSATPETGLDITMYELQDQTLLDMLGTLAANGVAVRVILNASNGSQARNQAAFTSLQASNVQVKWASALYEVTHQKTIRVGAQSMIMTLNTQSQYYATSRDFAILNPSAVDAAAVETVFDADFAGTAITPPLGQDLVWSPTNSKSVLLDIINGATTTLVVESEEMSDPNIIAALCARAKAGVDVQVVMTNDPSWASPFNTLTAAGVRVATYAANASLYIHAKVTLADAGLATQRGFLGSENDGTVSLTENRELGMQFTDPGLIGQLAPILAGDFAGATLWTPTAPALTPQRAGALAAALHGPAPTQRAVPAAPSTARPLKGRPSTSHELG